MGPGWLSRWLNPAARARARALDRFRGEVRAACDAREYAAADRLQWRRAELDLSEEDAAIELEMIDGLRETGELAAVASANGLPALETNHRVLGRDRCYLAVPMSLPDRHDQAFGKLFLTDRRIVWLAGPTPSTLSWGGVGPIRREQRDLVVLTADRQNVHRFRCNSYGEAMRAAFIAEWHLQKPGGRGDAPA